jgi:A/G-specific adenine glycosylase
VSGVADAASVRAIRAPLLRWYRKHRRDLPWRRTRDPYAIWVSEVMLQQTRVAVVLPYYERFLRRFPDVGALASAQEEDVLAAWSGLGYYRRARGLLEGARQVIDRHAGRVPDDVHALRELPGVGRYTAGAIASVAFGREAAIVDGNVRRVLTRILALRKPRESVLWRNAQTLVHGTSPGDLNQALMELGATICAPRSPSCASCPVAARCGAHQRGDAERYPASEPAKETILVPVAVAIVERGGAIVLERPGATSPLRGAWDLPAFELPARSDPRACVEKELERRHGLTVRAVETRGTLGHTILHRRLHIDVVGCRVIRGSVRGRPDLRRRLRHRDDSGSGIADDEVVATGPRDAVAVIKLG